MRRFIEDGLFEGGTVGDLAAKIGMDGEALTRTIKRCKPIPPKAGVDEEKSQWDERAGPLQRRSGGERYIPRTLYAVAVWPSDLASSAGLRTVSINGSAIGRRPFQGTLCCRYGCRIDLPWNISWTGNDDTGRPSLLPGGRPSEDAAS